MRHAQAVVSTSRDPSAMGGVGARGTWRNCCDSGTFSSFALHQVGLGPMSDGFSSGSTACSTDFPNTNRQRRLETAERGETEARRCRWMDRRDLGLANVTG